MTERVCKNCKGPLPEPARGQPGRPRQYCSENCRKRLWEWEHRTPCVVCGELVWSGDYCPEHAANRRGHALRLQQIEEMYNAGVAVREISRVLGLSRTSILGREFAELRRAGRIGYRYKAYAEKRAA